MVIVLVEVYRVIVVTVVSTSILWMVEMSLLSTLGKYIAVVEIRAAI